ncbi:ATP-dependent DNA helicase PIF1 [Contarinia nasturtii]|uniref:ATP-dependent DNA helicase PIF1 n=1 Tax=Contarinia nasturtii TaxID=265458 RepID=UPI0012D37E9E|nr:ATP-dependent DNA helicase PIF1 [Contarinia nasturtii]
MNSEDTVITCAIIIDWLNTQGISVRKITHKLATLRLVRSDTRELFIEVSTEKSPTSARLLLRDIIVHKKFMSEGKASIKFNRDKCMLYASNAPPGLLMNFLRTLFIKMTSANGQEGNGSGKLQDVRTRMLSENPSKFDDISPVTNLEVARAKKMAGISKATPTTPSPPSKKRKFDQVGRDANGESNARGNLMKKANNGPTVDVEPQIRLNDEQNEVLKACINGKNVFFTGSAGTGKSFLLKKIISVLPPDGTVATASTGVAACLIGGVTLHSFCGIGAGDAGLQRCIDLASRPAAAQAWRKCKRLIIDEISMVDGEYFEKIEAVARNIRKNDKPFGGIQLILCGDFLQLPPVIKTTYASQQSQSKRFCFQTETWQKVISISYELKQVHRQKDPEFIRILNFIRVGHVNDDIAKRLIQTSKQKIEVNGILATQLCSHTNDSNLINESKLANLKTEQRVFEAQDSDSVYTKQLDSQVMAPSRLTLKIGAQVMLLKNINVSDGLVNGARGVVTGFSTDGGLPILKMKNNKQYTAKPEKWIIKTPAGMLITRKQIPVKLAWAFSIHKSQGLTLDCVEMSLSKVFEAGQAYVALSRAQSLDSIRILDFDMKQVWADPDVLRFYKMFRRQLHDQTFIPLGQRSKSSNDVKPRSNGLTKLKKSLMDKPLVNIC